MRPEKCLHWLLATALLLCLASLVYAHEFRCAHCGRGGECCKVCRLVCEDKKVDVVCWGVKCEEFCVSCPGQRCEEHSETVCNECDCDPETPSSKPQKFVWTRWLPTKAEMLTRRKLMKKTITKSVPTYKWVVEDLCPNCEAHCPCASVKPGVDLPPVPVSDAIVLFGNRPDNDGSATK